MTKFTLKRAMAMFFAILMVLSIAPLSLAADAFENIANEAKVPEKTVLQTEGSRGDSGKFFNELTYTQIQPNAVQIGNLGGMGSEWMQGVAYDSQIAEQGKQYTHMHDTYAIGYKVNLQAGTNVQIYTECTENTPAGYFDTYLYLLDYDNHLVLAKDDDGNKSDYPGCSRVTYTVTVTDTYFIVVCGFTQGTQGELATAVITYPTAEIDDLDYSSDVVIEQSVPVTIDSSSKMFYLTDRAVRGVGYSITLSENQYLGIRTQEGISNVTFTLLDESYNILETSIDGELGFRAPSAGTYYIAASTHNDKDSLSFTMLLEAETVPESIVIVPDEITLQQGRRYTLTTEILPANATDKSVVWSSSDTNIATVSENGLVKAGLENGTATITARTVNGIEAICTVTVIDPEPPTPGGPDIFVNGFNSDTSVWTNGWVRFTRDDYLYDDDGNRYLMNEWLTDFDDPMSAHVFIAGDYVATDGMYYMLAAVETASGLVYSLYSVDPATWNETLVRANVPLPGTASIGWGTNLGLSYDYANEVMWAYVGDSKWLYQFDVETGEFVQYQKLDAVLYGLACSTEGKLYGLGHDDVNIIRPGDTEGSNREGLLYQINKNTGECVTLRRYRENITPWYASPSQVMTYDHIEDTLLIGWHNRNLRTLYEVDLDTYDVFDHGPVWDITDDYVSLVDNEGNIYYAPCGIVIFALFTVPTAEQITPDLTVVTGINIVESSISVYENRTLRLTAEVFPSDAFDDYVIWTSSDTSIATVDDRGRVSGVSAGSVTITAETRDGGYTDTCAVTVNPLPSYTSGEWFFGYGLYDSYNEVSTTFFATLPSDPSVLDIVTYPQVPDLYAGEYFDGNLYVVDSQAFLYKMKVNFGGVWTVTPIATTGLRVICDMAFDYSTYTMLALGEYANSVGIYKMDLVTGQVKLVADLGSLNAYTMGCTTEGQIYFLTADGNLYSFDKASGNSTLVGSTGQNLQYIQSMTYDHNTGKMYWASCLKGDLFEINLQTAEVTSMGPVGNGTVETSAAFMIPVNPPSPPDPIAVTGITLDRNELSLNTEERYQLNHIIAPSNATNDRVTWTTSDESVAQVTKSGVVRAVSAGTATISVITEDGGYKAECVITVAAREVEYDGNVYASTYTSFDNAIPELSWLAFKPAELPAYEIVVDFVPMYFISGEYYNGVVFGFDPAGYFRVMDLEKYELTTIAYTGFTPYDMCYNYDDGIMYASYGIDLYSIDLTTGAHKKVATLDVEGFDIAALSAGPDGKMYVIDSEGILYEIDNTTYATTYVTTSSYLPAYAQSMTYDYETGMIYWACLTENISEIVVIDVENKAFEVAGSLGSTLMQFTALYNLSTPDQGGTDLPILGDANGDGNLNTGDASYILQYIIGGRTLDDRQKIAADVNQDGTINTGDAAMILQYAAGTIPAPQYK